MAITLVGILDSTEGTQTIAFAENITDRYFNHENMVNAADNENKQGAYPDKDNPSTILKRSINEYLYQRSYKPYFFTCGTAADTAAKAITGASGWGLSSTDLIKIWPLVRVKFTNTNTVANPTLNINNTGAKPIYYGGSAISATNAGILKGIVTLMYNGTTSGSEYWDFISGDTTTFISEATAADNILHGTSSGSEITYAPYSSTTADSTWVGTDGNGGKLYLGDVNPTKTNRLNLNGHLYAKKLYSDGIEVKVIQTAVSDPSADGNSTSFIATISQDTNGVITVTKKNLGTATTTTAGAIKVGAVKNSAVTNASTNDTNTAKRYAVLVDSNGLAYTNVPWVDTNTTYSSGNEITISNSNAINHNVKLSGGFTPTTTGATISGYGGSGSFKIPVLTVNEYGHVTNASEATVSITLPDNKITSYNAPTYDTAHVSPTYQNVINANVITTNMVYDTAINKLDYKIAGLTKEVIDDEATLSQAIEDEPRYFAKSSTAAGTATKNATLVESRNYNLINGTKVTVYFSTANTANNPILVNVNNTGAKVLIYNDDVFDGNLIENGTTLEMVYDDNVNFVVGESPNTTTYTECYRVVGGVGSGSGGADTKTDQTVIANPSQDASDRPLLIAKGTTASTSINDETLFAKNLYYTPKADTLCVGNVKTTRNVTATGNISGTNITASGKFSGIAEITANQYFSSSKYGIDMQNSDIIHANSIFCNDTSEKGEGLHFFRANNTYDSLRIDNGGLVKFDKGWGYSSGTVTGGTTYDVAISASQTASGITVQTAGTASDKYYPVQTNPDTGMAVVNVPWSGGGGGVGGMRAYSVIPSTITTVSPMEFVLRIFEPIVKDNVSNDVTVLIDRLRAYEGMGGIDGHIPVGSIILFYAAYLNAKSLTSGRLVWDTPGRGDYFNYIVCNGGYSLYETDDTSYGDEQALNDNSVTLFTFNWADYSAAGLPEGINDHTNTYGGRAYTYNLGFNSQSVLDENYNSVNVVGASPTPATTVSMLGGNANNYITHRYTFHLSDIEASDKIAILTRILDQLRSEGAEAAYATLKAGTIFTTRTEFFKKIVVSLDHRSVLSGEGSNIFYGHPQ